MGKCRHSRSCRYYCQVTDTCDFFVNTGRRRPEPAAQCKGYPRVQQRKTSGIFMPGSYVYDRDGKPVAKVKDNI